MAFFGDHSLRIKEFADLNSAKLDEVMKLYSSSFLPVETKSIENVLSMLQHDSNYHLYSAHLDGSMVGFSLLYIFKDLRAGLLDYMAVSLSHQRKGIGKALFGYTFRTFQEKIKEPTGLLLEIQNEKYASDDQDRKARKDRLRFYKKNGAKIITDHYLLPPQHGSKPEETYLMIVPCNRIGFLSKELILGYVKAIHSQVYHYHSDDLLEKIAGTMPEKSVLKDIVT